MNKTTNNYGVGFVGLLQIVFIVLKFYEVIKWSWFWVFSPIWMFATLVILLYVVYLMLVIIERRIK